MRHNIRVSQVGEKRLIREIYLAHNKKYRSRHVALDLGDDAGIVKIKPGNQVVVTTDKIPEKPIALEVGIMDYFHLGFYSGIANISDLAAMGASPLGLVSSFGLPFDFLVRDVAKLFNGVNAAGQIYGIKLFSGDTGSSSAFNITTSAIGQIEKNRALTRNGAKPKDKIFVTGAVGLFSSALLYFLKKHLLKGKFSRNEIEKLRNRLIRPRAQILAGRILSNSGLCTSCQDITDGLLQTVKETSEASRCGFLVHLDKLPIDPITNKLAEIFKRAPWEIAITIGADFELLFGIKQGNESVVTKALSRNGIVATEIGEFTRSSKLLSREGKAFSPPDKKWEHFRGKDSSVILKQILE